MISLISAHLIYVIVLNMSAHSTYMLHIFIRFTSVIDVYTFDTLVSNYDMVVCTVAEECDVAVDCQ